MLLQLVSIPNDFSIWSLYFPLQSPQIATSAFGQLPWKPCFACQDTPGSCRRTVPMTPHWLRLRIAVGSPAQGSVSPIKTMVQSGPYFLDLLDSSYLRVTGRWWNAKHDFVVAECCLRIWQVTGGIIYDVVILCYALGKKTKKTWVEIGNFATSTMFSSTHPQGWEGANWLMSEPTSHRS